MDFLHSLPKEIVSVVVWGLVPLFLLYNIVGWAGLAQREADRSKHSPGRPPLSDQELSDLKRSIRGAWYLGAILALGLLCAAFQFFQALLMDTTPVFRRVVIAGGIGAVAGVARGILPRLNQFRQLSSNNRRRILSALVICAVSVSITCAVLYYCSGKSPQAMIASAYMCMFIGYGGVHVLDVAR
jgi:hypothetical protein